MTGRPKWLSFRNAAIIATALAVVIFLIGVDYNSRFSLLSNIMRADLHAGVIFPYRWFLACLVIFVAAVGIWGRQNSN
jgi:hypothetical protein